MKLEAYASWLYADHFQMHKHTTDPYTIIHAYDVV